MLELLEVSDQSRNRILAFLTKAESNRLSPHLELVPLSTGETLSEAGSRLKNVYFPTTAVVSLLYVMKNGATAEIAMVGNDGLVGIPLFMGNGVSVYRSFVQFAGYAYRLKGQVLKREFARAGSLHNLLLRYTLERLRETAQTAVCNRHHTVDQQLCRWLLLSLDRLPSNHLCVTHDLIATGLGVRREGVTEAAGNLQREGLIHYNRGHITVVDRAGLEARVCECYETTTNASRALLPKWTPAAPALSR